MQLNKSVFRYIRHVLCCLGFFGLLVSGYAQSNLDFFTDTTNRTNVSFESGYVAGSSVMDIDYANTFLYGGTIDREMKDRAYNRLKNNNRFGLDFSMNLQVEIPKDTLFGRGDLSMVFGLKYFDHIDASFGPDLFRLAFDGNKQFAGETVDLGNVNYNQYRFQYLSMGLVKRKEFDHGIAREGILVNLIKGEEHHIVNVYDGSLYTEELGRELQLAMNYNYNRTDTGSTGLGAINGIGIGTDLFTEFFLENGAKIRFEVRDLGFVYWNNQSIEMRTDSTFTYDGITINNIFDLNDTIVDQLSQDSIIDNVTQVNRLIHYSTALPTSVNIEYTQFLNQKWKLNAGVYYKILSNYFPYLYSNWYYYVNPTLSTRVHLAYGGYGKLNTGIAFAKSFKFIDITIGTNNLEGFILPDKAFANSGFVQLKKYF